LWLAIVRASAGRMPLATATRTIWLMWPSSTMKLGSRSSVQKQQCSSPCSFTSGRRSTRLRAIDASRSITPIPSRRFSSASAKVVASWSERIPAAT